MSKGGYGKRYTIEQYEEALRRVASGERAGAVAKSMRLPQTTVISWLTKPEPRYITKAKKKRQAEQAKSGVKPVELEPATEQTTRWVPDQRVEHIKRPLSREDLSAIVKQEVQEEIARLKNTIKLEAPKFTFEDLATCLIDLVADYTTAKETIKILEAKVQSADGLAEKWRQRAVEISNIIKED